MPSYRNLILLATLGACHAERPAGLPPWRDTSPHTVQMVAIAPAESLEVLDWGGKGQPLVLLAGLGNTAHVYDDLAPALTDTFHVYGITRRGYGRSSQPPDSDVSMLVADLRAVLDSFRLSRVVLVGHSIAGEELTGFAASYPDRCQALVYLEAAYDRSDRDSLSKVLDHMPWPGRPPMKASDSASVTALEAYYERTDGIRMQDADARAIFRFDAAGRYQPQDSLARRTVGRLLQHLPSPAYPRLRCPSLAIYAVPDSPATLVPYYALLDSTGQAEAVRIFPVMQALTRTSIAQYRREAPSSHVVEIHNANHFVFLSNRAQTLQAMRAFFAGVSASTPMRPTMSP